MKPHMKRGLTKVALALMLAGYCAVPVAMAEDAACCLGRQWNDS